MSINRAKTRDQEQAGTIKRVVRRGHTYICGLCRKNYETGEEAQGCVQVCWSDTLSLDPVIQRRRGRKLLFKCRFCARDYRSGSEAMVCASECKTVHVAQFEKEKAVAIANLQGKIPSRSRYGAAVKAKAVFKSKVNFSRKDDEFESTEEEVVPIPEDTEETVAPVVAESDGTERKVGPAKPKKAEKDADKWFRENAEYVCAECQQKYYTKVETIKCYDAHFEEEPPAAAETPEAEDESPQEELKEAA